MGTSGEEGNSTQEERGKKGIWKAIYIYNVYLYTHWQTKNPKIPIMPTLSPFHQSSPPHWRGEDYETGKKRLHSLLKKDRLSYTNAHTHSLKITHTQSVSGKRRIKPVN